MINFFIETKSEYTIQLVNVLTPLIYEGIQSIYTEALKVSNESNNVLKVFQSFLKRIPKWNQEMIKQETDRIMNNSKSFSWLSDLVKATVKANIIVLTYNPGNKNVNKIDPKYYQGIKIEDFIHKIYIECARELWNNPYLMYHQYAPIELKRNQRDTINLVKESIKEAIRKLLPVKEILEIYLDEKLEANVPNDDFDRNVTEADEKNIQKLIRKGLDEPNSLAHGINNPGTSNSGANNIAVNNPVIPPPIPQIGGNDNDLNTKILEIINKKSSELNSATSKKSNDTPLTKATKNITSSSGLTSDSDSKTHSKHSSKKSIKIQKGGDFDDKIKNILEKDLGEEEIDTSLSYHPETNDNNYQEIFSNNIGGQNSTVNNINNKDSSKSKRKFFNNYLNF
jgi:hypothetical protein